jgi:hypothetical protein
MSQIEATLERPSFGMAGSLDAAQYDDDDVLDRWLASMSPDTFERVLGGLADDFGSELVRLDPTA